MKNSKPRQSYTVGGFRPTGRFRIRIGLFGLVFVEELYEYSDGSSRWKRLPWMMKVEFNESKSHENS